MLDVMRCLAADLKDSPADTKAHRILQFMVEAKISALEQEKIEPQRFERSSLLLNVEGKAKADTLNPTTWLPQNLLEKHLESRMASLTARLKNSGLDQIPVVRTNDAKGGKGIQRCYWLDVTQSPQGPGSDEQLQQWSRIEYKRSAAGEVRPAWLLRCIFQNGELKNRSRRGLSLLISIIVGIFFWTVWFLSGLWGVSSFDQALTLRQVGISLFFLCCLWLIWKNLYSPWIKLVDDRVIKAPDALLAIFQDSAELEMHRDSEKQQWTRFVRFSGDCPLCGGRVLLMPGKPDQKLPLVGRCNESPHAHVFSFDRARLLGNYIGPPLD